MYICICICICICVCMCIYNIYIYIYTYISIDMYYGNRVGSAKGRKPPHPVWAGRGARDSRSSSLSVPFVWKHAVGMKDRSASTWPAAIDTNGLDTNGSPVSHTPFLP